MNPGRRDVGMAKAFLHFRNICLALERFGDGRRAQAADAKLSQIDLHLRRVADTIF
jgi:hypothetical protein